MNRAVIAIGVLIATLSGVAIAAWDPSDRVLLIVAIGVVLAAPIVVRVVQGRFEILEPIVWINAAFAVMFVLRPAAVLAYDTPVYRLRFDPVPPTFDEALVVALVAILAMYAAYFSDLGRRLSARIPKPAATYNRDNLAAGALAAALLGIGLYSVFAFQAGVSPLSLLFGGPQAAQSDATAYLYLAPFMVVPAALILFKLGISERRPVVTAIAVLTMVGLINSLAPGGQRLWLLVLLSSLAIYPMLRTGWRPGVVVLLVTAAIGLVFTVSMRDLSLVHADRGLGEAVVYTVEHPTGSMEELLTGPDTEMYNSLALLLQFVPEEYGFHPGLSVTSLLAHPVPRLLWPGKPYPMESIVNPALFRVDPGQASAAYSILGGFYYDGGLIGVAVGMFLVGLLWRTLFEWLLAARGRDMAYVIYALSLPFTIVLARGNLPDTAGRALFVIGPAVLIAYLAGSRVPFLARTRTAQSA